MSWLNGAVRFTLPVRDALRRIERAASHRAGGVASGVQRRIDLAASPRPAATQSVAYRMECGYRRDEATRSGVRMITPHTISRTSDLGPRTSDSGL